MADTPAHTNSKANTNESPERATPPKTPRWVKVFGIVAVVLILVVAVLHISSHGLGDHHMNMDHGGQMK